MPYLSVAIIQNFAAPNIYSPRGMLLVVSALPISRSARSWLRLSATLVPPYRTTFSARRVKVGWWGTSSTPNTPNLSPDEAPPIPEHSITRPTTCASIDTSGKEIKGPIRPWRVTEVCFISVAVLVNLRVRSYLLCLHAFLGCALLTWLCNPAAEDAGRWRVWCMFLRVS
jgi:hypothetical protein